MCASLPLSLSLLGRPQDTWLCTRFLPLDWLNNTLSRLVCLSSCHAHSSYLNVPFPFLLSRTDDVNMKTMPYAKVGSSTSLLEAFLYTWDHFINHCHLHLLQLVRALPPLERQIDALLAFDVSFLVSRRHSLPSIITTNSRIPHALLLGIFKWTLQWCGSSRLCTPLQGSNSSLCSLQRGDD